VNATPDFVRDPRLMRGSNHNGMRQFNERIVLQAIRHHGAMAKADLARLTQLSTQTVSIIVDRLLGDELLLKQDRVRGKIGQPSVPLSLNPDGAFSLGLQVGRRSLEVLVSDFLGQPRHQLQFSYPYPDPDVVLPNIRQSLAQMQAAMGPHWARLVGIGLTSPLSLHQWSDLLGGAKVDMLGNLLQRLFTRSNPTNWPLGSALALVFMALLTFVVVLYFRSTTEEDR
jgi:hypothetical protein